MVDILIDEIDEWIFLGGQQLTPSSVPSGFYTSRAIFSFSFGRPCLEPADCVVVKHMTPFSSTAVKPNEAGSAVRARDQARMPEVLIRRVLQLPDHRGEDADRYYEFEGPGTVSKVITGLALPKVVVTPAGCESLHRACF